MRARILLRAAHCAVVMTLCLPARASPAPDAAAPAGKKGSSVLASAIVKDLEQATLVMVGEVTAVRRSPGVWSGAAAALQWVEYRVQRTLKGGAVGPTVAVGHLLVHGSPTADPKQPKLRSSIFHPGARLVVFARKESPGWVALNEVDAVQPADEALVSALLAHLSR